MQARTAYDAGFAPPPGPGGSAAPSAAVAAEVADDNRRWVQELSGHAAMRERASGRLYPLLLRVARSETRRRCDSLRLTGPELDDLAHQAAGDAIVKICAKIATFRGDSRFSTWAHRFVALEVCAKLERHFWRRDTAPLDPKLLEDLPSRLTAVPELEAESHDLAAAVSCALLESLTARQRTVFLAVAVDGCPVAEIAARLGLTPHAVYKTLFDARRNLRSTLQADGFLPTYSA